MRISFVFVSFESSWCMLYPFVCFPLANETSFRARVHQLVSIQDAKTQYGYIDFVYRVKLILNPSYDRCSFRTMFESCAQRAP